MSKMGGGGYAENRGGFGDRTGGGARSGGLGLGGGRQGSNNGKDFSQMFQPNAQGMVFDPRRSRWMPPGSSFLTGGGGLMRRYNVPQMPGQAAAQRPKMPQAPQAPMFARQQMLGQTLQSGLPGYTSFRPGYDFITPPSR